jgi:hypothetical protein
VSRTGVTQLASDSVVSGAWPRAVLKLAPAELSARAGIDWQRVRDDAGELDTAVVQTGKDLPVVVLHSYTADPHRIVVLANEDVPDEAVLRSLKAMGVRSDEIEHAARPQRAPHQGAADLQSVLSELSTRVANLEEHIGRIVDDSESTLTIGGGSEGRASLAPSSSRISKGNDTDRYVVPNRERGGYDIVKEDRRRVSARARTQRDAIKRAKEIVANLGGGEVRVQGQDGRFRQADTVAGPRKKESKPRDGRGRRTASRRSA